MILVNCLSRIAMKVRSEEDGNAKVVPESEKWWCLTGVVTRNSAAMPLLNFVHVQIVPTDGIFTGNGIKAMENSSIFKSLTSQNWRPQ